MLIFGRFDNCPSVQTMDELGKAKEGFAVLNMSSLFQSCHQLVGLLPKGIGQPSDEDFDMKYFDYIMNNRYSFIDMMSIMMELYQGKNVYVLIGDSELFYDLAISLSEIIKQRYGYVSVFIESAEDWDWVVRNQYNTDFSVIGLHNFDIDRSNYISLLQQLNLIKVDEDYYD